MWSILALEDRQAIFDYVELDKPSAAVRLDDRIESQVAALGQFPEMGREGRVKNTRELVVERTPYIAAYRVHKEKVDILRVLHSARIWPDSM